MPTLLICSACDPLDALAAQFANAAATLLPALNVALWPENFDPEDVIAVAAWHPPTDLLGSLPNLKMVASIGAGTEHILRCPDLPVSVPITRIVDPEQARGMAEYVLWAALYYHRGFDLMARQQADGLWRMPPQRPASEFHVGVMGMGGMGKPVALTLRDSGFVVSAWSRSAQILERVRSHTGDDELSAFLAPLDLVVCLLPLTPATRGLCNAALFAQMKAGAAFVNVGRGEQVVMPDLLAALDSEHLGGAVLDVFESEPLTQDEALWRHPRMVITPHMASSASDQTITQQILQNVQRLQNGQPPRHTVDRQRCY
jgi:glyoxylate/hydroxypyruvate reductase A